MLISVITSSLTCRCRAIVTGIFILLVFAFNGFADNLVTARIPVTVNVGATVSLQPSVGVAGVGTAREVEADKEEIFEIIFDAGSVNVSHRQQRQRSEVVSYGRGRVSLKLPLTYGNADIALHTLDGKRILNGKVTASAGTSKISGSNVAPGVYMLSVKGFSGSLYSTRLTHNGGRLNIEVVFGAEAFSPLNKNANSAGVGTWTITTTAVGYKTDVRTFTPESVAGLNPAQNITLSAVQNLCEGFVDGTEREHHGNMKPQFCDERDGQKYVYVTIGNQVWMAENLNFARDSSWCYENSEDSCTKYGRLYTWTSAMDIGSEYLTKLWTGSDVNHQGICPEGWHLPDTAEWKILLAAADGSYAAGIMLKSTTGWHDSYNGTDKFGFSALPGGVRRPDGVFDYFGDLVDWWSATDYSVNRAWHFMSWSGRGVEDEYLNKTEGNSLRCVRNVLQ